MRLSIQAILLLGRIASPSIFSKPCSTSSGRISVVWAWRPISLLSCLGKGLERLIARRLAWADVHNSVLLPKRAATDLVTALIHDMEEAFARKKVATLATMDIQGAFDTVMRNRLVLRLREQGWPYHLARWAESFMEDRSARARYQDTITHFAPLQCGLPQGSPVSPILFLLHTGLIYQLGNPQGRFGYADDTAILSIGDTVDETTAMASSSIDEMVRWGAAKGVSFDPKKTEVMHVSRSKFRTGPAIRHGDSLYNADLENSLLASEIEDDFLADLADGDFSSPSSYPPFTNPDPRPSQSHSVSLQSTVQASTPHRAFRNTTAPTNATTNTTARELSSTNCILHPFGPERTTTQLSSASNSTGESQASLPVFDSLEENDFFFDSPASSFSEAMPPATRRSTTAAAARTGSARRPSRRSTKDILFPHTPQMQYPALTSARKIRCVLGDGGICVFAGPDPWARSVSRKFPYLAEVSLFCCRFGNKSEACQVEGQRSNQLPILHEISLPTLYRDKGQNSLMNSQECKSQSGKLRYLVVGMVQGFSCFLCRILNI
ncbi:putative zinc-binding oxidoreductase [Fusarium oxysporum f. sp. albedinis]|nr:putative zinc-binding oxidoreductase [Fusarium oxysporum f. sp. albedinis]